MKYKCPKCGGWVVDSESLYDPEDSDDEEYWAKYIGDRCRQCGWKYEPRWHDNPNLPSTEFIALCIVIIFSLFFLF